MNRAEAVQAIIDKLNAKNYLEIGVQRGSCFLKIKAKNKLAVDPQFQISFTKKLKAVFKNPANFNNQYFEQPSNDFFEEQVEYLSQNPIDVALIDGLHTYHQSLKDVENTLEFLHPNGVIVMHDCNPPSEAAAFPAASHEAAKKELGNIDVWCGDVWKTIVYLRSQRKDLQVFVLDTDYGLGIITRKRVTETLNYTPEQIQKLTYSDLEQNRTHLLELKNHKNFSNFINTLHPIL